MKVLIVRNDKLGDFVLSIPVFQALKRHNQNIKTYALVSGFGEELAGHINEIDAVITDRKGSSIKMLKDIRGIKPDMSITLFSTFRTGLVLFLSGIRYRIAPATKIAQIFHNRRIVQRRSRVRMKEFEYNLELLKTIDKDMDLTVIKPVIAIDERNGRMAMERFRKTCNINEDSRYIAFHPGSGGSSKGNLTIEEYINLARIVNDYKKYRTVFIFGPTEKGLMEEIRKKIDYESIFYHSNYGIYDFCALISNFSMFVSTSTATMHLAGAVNINTLSFFGEDIISSSRRWAPLNDLEKQRNFMIPSDTERKKKVVDNIENELRSFIEHS